MHSNGSSTRTIKVIRDRKCWVNQLLNDFISVAQLYMHWTIFSSYLSYLTVWEMTQSLTASCIAGALMLFDVGVLILNRYILLDPILLFFISFATYSMAKFRNCSNSPFSQVNEQFCSKKLFKKSYETSQKQTLNPNISDFHFRIGGFGLRLLVLC